MKGFLSQFQTNQKGDSNEMYDTASRVALVRQRVREDAGGYVLVAVVSFAAAAAITALCFRLRIRENQKKDGADNTEPQKQEGKTT